jgi:hypothetical protein
VQWLPVLASSVSVLVPLPVLAESVSPVSSAAGDIMDYILGYGVLGVAAVLFTLRIIVPRSAVDDAKAQARTDLLEENRRLIEERNAADRRADEQLRFAQDQLVPLLVSFNATVAALLPVLQDLTRQREDNPAPRRRGRELP